MEEETQELETILGSSLDEDSDNNEIETENTESTEEYPEHLDPIIKENTTRFQSAKWFEKVKTLSIAIIGCGGIGSYTGFLVSRLHPANIALFDFDIGFCFHFRKSLHLH